MVCFEIFLSGGKVLEPQGQRPTGHRIRPSSIAASSSTIVRRGQHKKTKSWHACRSAAPRVIAEISGAPRAQSRIYLSRIILPWRWSALRRHRPSSPLLAAVRRRVRACLGVPWRLAPWSLGVRRRWEATCHNLRLHFVGSGPHLRSPHTEILLKAWNRDF